MFFVVVTNPGHAFCKKTAQKQNGFSHEIRVSKVGLLKTLLLKGLSKRCEINATFIFG